MNLTLLRGQPEPGLAVALRRFEGQFVYPLGLGQSFRIDHGRDYTRFLRSLGEATCFVISDGDEVLGVIGVALRTIRLPDGSLLPTAYLCDLKVSRATRRGWVLRRLVEQLQAWVADRATTAYCVVMDGTTVTPDRYTGRLCIPTFRPVAHVEILKVPCVGDARDSAASDHVLVDRRRLTERYNALSADQCSATPPRCWSRPSDSSPAMVLADGAACGCIEHTLDAKRIVMSDGAAVSCSHLSSFAFRDARAAASLIRGAAQESMRRGFVAMFVAVPSAHARAVVRALGPMPAPVDRASASVYAHGLPPGHFWNINTAEI